MVEEEEEVKSGRETGCFRFIGAPSDDVVDLAIEIDGLMVSMAGDIGLTWLESVELGSREKVWWHGSMFVIWGMGGTRNEWWCGWNESVEMEILLKN